MNKTEASGNAEVDANSCLQAVYLMARQTSKLALVAYNLTASTSVLVAAGCASFKPFKLVAKLKNLRSDGTKSVMVVVFANGSVGCSFLVSGWSYWLVISALSNTFKLNRFRRLCFESFGAYENTP